MIRAISKLKIEKTLYSLKNDDSNKNFIGVSPLGQNE